MAQLSARVGSGEVVSLATVLDHVSLGVTDLVRSVAFYDAVLGALGFVRVFLNDSAAGYGPRGAEDKLALFTKAGVVSSAGMHLAFSATTESQVRGFHEAALAHGGSSDGAPGLRPRYGPGYFAAFVLDPDGHRLEAVCHAPTA